jgi:hypothetical protein
MTADGAEPRARFGGHRPPLQCHRPPTGRADEYRLRVAEFSD